MTAHARLSPSASRMWMACPGQPNLASKVENRSSAYADEGTDAHWLASEIILGRVKPVLGVKCPKGNMSTLDMLRAVGVYVAEVRRQIQDGDDWDVEQRLKYSDELYGTADFTRYRPATGELCILDYKHGANVGVEVFNNPQPLIYGLMKAKYLGNQGITSISFGIVQPRFEHPDGPIRYWTIDAVELLDFEDKLLAAVEATRKPDAPLNPGSHCRWCPAKAICPANKALALEAAQKDFGPGLPYEPKELAATLEKLPIIESWVKATREFAYAEAMAGNAIPGFKLVEKRATRKWANEADAAAALENILPRDELYEPPSLLSPAKIEKLLGKDGKKQIASLTVAESSGLTLVHQSDKRPPASRATAAEDFGAA